MEYWDSQEGKQDAECTASHFYLQLLNHQCLLVQPKLFADTLDSSQEITAPFCLVLNYHDTFKLDITNSVGYTRKMRTDTDPISFCKAPFVVLCQCWLCGQLVPKVAFSPKIIPDSCLKVKRKGHLYDSQGCDRGSNSIERAGWLIPTVFSA